jgi:pimeloyl-ACP methyl ester carboxylesterase
MTLFLKTALGALALASLSGCMRLTIDEQTAFLPPDRPQGPAVTAPDMTTRWGEAAARALAPAGYTLETVGPTQQRLVAADARPTVAVEHGFIALPDAGRLAWTSFSRVAADPAAPARPLIVHCAGNSGDRYNSSLGYSGKALPWGDVLVFDYPGYGDSTGSPSAAALEAATGALLGDLAARSTARDLVFWGHSLGGFICARLAEQAEGADALILETTARNASEVAKAWKPWWSGPFLRINVADSLASYDTAEAAKAFGGPVLVLGAAQDQTLPVSLARSLAKGAEALGADVTYVEFPRAAHRTVPDQAEFTATVDGFLNPILND